LGKNEVGRIAGATAKACRASIATLSSVALGFPVDVKAITATTGYVVDDLLSGNCRKLNSP